jgi:hypothetical protein
MISYKYITVLFNVVVIFFVGYLFYSYSEEVKALSLYYQVSTLHVCDNRVKDPKTAFISREGISYKELEVIKVAARNCSVTSKLPDSIVNLANDIQFRLAAVDKSKTMIDAENMLKEK